MREERRPPIRSRSMNGSRDDSDMIPRNILFFVTSLHTGGAELHLLNLCRYLTGQGIRVSVCTLDMDGGTEGPI